MNPLHQLLAGLALGGSLLAAGQTQVVDSGFLARLRSEAARSHPSAVSGKDKAAAAFQDVRSVRLWNDPMLGFGLMAADPAMRADEGDIMIGLEQALPKPGLFAARRGKAEAMARAEAQNARTSSLAAGAQAARSGIELALVDESIRLQESQVAWMAAMAENAKQMAANPMGSSTDALRMETELARERQMLDAARRNRAGLASKLNLALGRRMDSPWPDLKLPRTPPPVPLAQTEIARIPDASPKFLAMRELVGAARAEKRMADRERLPDVALGVDTRTYSGGDFRSAAFGVKVSLPWFNNRSYRAKIEAARSRELAAGRDAETMRRELATMVLSAATEAANAAAQARAFSGEIHEKALKAMQTTEAAWISSKAPLTDLLDSSRALFGIRLEERRMLAMELATLEELNTLVPDR